MRKIFSFAKNGSDTTTTILEGILLCRMKLLLLSYIFAFGNACSNVTDNTNVLERAFGPVITAKLEDTSEDIKGLFQSGLTQQNGQLEESLRGILNETKEEFQQIINSRFEEQDEKIKGYIGQILQQFGQLFEQKEVLNQDCPEDWTRIEDSCYFISDEKLNITQAQDKCQDLAEDGKLFEPKNLRQNDLVYTLLKTTKGISSNDHYFIGINDRNEEGQ